MGKNWRHQIYKIIFEANTPLGRIFDLLLIFFILLSVVFIILDSISSFQLKYGEFFIAAEWFFTILFTLEYLLRIISVRRKRGYIFSFFGIIDLLSILPTYLSIFFVGAQSLLVLRALRILRIFRILKLARYTNQGKLLVTALKASSRKIFIFIIAVLILTIILGTVMFMVEGTSNGFASIPQSIYWTIVTMTTVGYGDIVPITPFGKVIASIVMLIGYGIIAVPTGIVSVEIAEATRKQRERSGRVCKECSREDHDLNAKHCKHCGAKL